MVMRMEEGLDTGPVAMAEKVAIVENMTAAQLHDTLSQSCADLMIRAMGALERGQLMTTPQPEAGVTYAAKIDKSEARIDWSKPARQVHDHIRGLSPFPGAWCEMRLAAHEPEKFDRVKILQSQLAEGHGEPGEVLDDNLTIACGKGAVRLIRLQRAGKGVQEAREFLLGNRVSRGKKIR